MRIDRVVGARPASLALGLMLGLPALWVSACDGGGASGAAPAGGSEASAGGQTGATGGAGSEAGGRLGSGGIESVGGQGGESDGPSRCFDAKELPACSTLTGGWGLLTRPDTAPVALFDVEELDGNAAFIALAGDAALVEFSGATTEEKYQVVRVNPGALPDEEQFSILRVSWPEAVGGWSVTALGASREAATSVLAIACDSERCVRLGAARNAGILLPLDEPELPLAGSYGIASGRDCVFGEGAFCLEGGAWRELPDLGASMGDRFVALGMMVMADDESHLMAVTDLGAMIAEGIGAWEVLRESDSSPASFASILPWKTSVLTAVGGWAETEWLDMGEECNQTTPLAFVEALSSDVETYLALGSDGQTYLRTIVFNSGDPADHRLTWCTHSEGPIAEFREASAWPCGNSTNLYGITATTLWSLLESPQCAQI